MVRTRFLLCLAFLTIPLILSGCSNRDLQLNSVSKDVSEPTVNTPGGGGEEEKILDTIKQSTNTNTEQIERDLKDLEGQLDLDFSIDDIAP